MVARSTPNVPLGPAPLSILTFSITSPVIKRVTDVLPAVILAACKSAAAIVKLPVSVLVAVVVPTTNLSALSSQAIIALSPVDQRSIRIPQSLAF